MRLERNTRDLAFAGFGGFLHLALFGHNGDVEQSECQYHHHQNECHVLNIVVGITFAKITVVPAK
jgi:hypothetical protein